MTKHATYADELGTLQACRCCGERCASMLQCLLRGEPEGTQFVVCGACAFAEVRASEPLQQPEET